MRQLLLAILLIPFIAISLSAQEVPKSHGELTEKQWDELVTALEKEDWVAAEKLSWDYLALVKTDDQAKTPARLRYMYLYSAAGKVAAGKMTYANLEKRIKDFAGKEIVFPYRRISNECHGSDSNTVCKGEDSKRLLITGTNRDFTTIHDFEYIRLKEAFDFEENDGKLAMIIGRIDSVSPNPNHSPMLILRIYVSDAYFKLRDMPTDK
jgi:hypothetical protein